MSSFGSCGFFARVSRLLRHDHCAGCRPGCGRPNVPWACGSWWNLVASRNAVSGCAARDRT